MNHDIAFLHTADVHVSTFQQLVDDIGPGLNVCHKVDETLLSEAVSDGITRQLELRVHAAMQSAASTGAGVVVCSCSTIGGVAEQCVLDGNVACQRIDRAMADLAVKDHQYILVVAAVASTLEPTQQLLQQSCESSGKTPEVSVRLIESAWELFESGRLDDYYDQIAQYLFANAVDYDCVILAQASMAPVLDRYADSFLEKDILALASPRLGVIAAVDRIKY